MYSDAFYNIQKQYVKETNQLLLSTKNDVLLLKKLLQQNHHTKENPFDMNDGKVRAYYKGEEIVIETQSLDFYVDVKECDFFKETEIAVSHIPYEEKKNKPLFSYVCREGREIEEFRLRQNTTEILDSSKEINTFLIHLEDVLYMLQQ